MAIVPYKQWEEMNRWKQEQRPRLPPDPNVVHTVSLQKDLSSVLADDDISEAEKNKKNTEKLYINLNWRIRKPYKRYNQHPLYYQQLREKIYKTGF